MAVSFSRPQIVSSITIGVNGASGIFDMNGGEVNAVGFAILNANSNANATAVLNINGGVANVKGISFAGSSNGFVTNDGVSAGRGTFNMNGGQLTIGSNGIYIQKSSGSFTYAINLSGGTIGAAAAWSSTLSMKLSNDHGGVTFNNAGANKITLSGTISGSGDLTKTGGGVLLLSGTNTYTGNTIISAGSLTVDTTGALTFVLGADGVNNRITGSGELSFDGAMIINTDSAAANGTWQLIDLGSLSANFGSTFKINGWQNDLVETDKWSLGDYTFSTLTGAVTTIPEPSTWALLISGGLVLIAGCVRKRR